MTDIKLHLNEPQDFWSNVLWTHETKMELVGLKAKVDMKHFIPIVKHGGGGVMIWSFVATTRPNPKPTAESLKNERI